MPEPSIQPSAAEIAGYIEDMLGYLAGLAGGHGLKGLATSLLMVAVEAARLAEGEPARRSG